MKANGYCPVRVLSWGRLWHELTLCYYTPDKWRWVPSYTLILKYLLIIYTYCNFVSDCWDSSELLRNSCTRKRDVRRLLWGFPSFSQELHLSSSSCPWFLSELCCSLCPCPALSLAETGLTLLTWLLGLILDLPHYHEFVWTSQTHKAIFELLSRLGRTRAWTWVSSTSGKFRKHKTILWVFLGKSNVDSQHQERAATWSEIGPFEYLAQNRQPEVMLEDGGDLNLWFPCAKLET